MQSSFKNIKKPTDPNKLKIKTCINTKLYKCTSDFVTKLHAM